MNAARRYLLASTLCAVALACLSQVASAQGRMPSAALLQAQLLRRVNTGQEVRGLFLYSAKVPDLSSWRSVALLDDKSATPLSPTTEADTEHVRLRVKVGRQLPLNADCPVVNALLSADGTMRVWDEQGWLNATYQRTASGWRIADFSYQPD